MEVGWISCLKYTLFVYNIFLAIAGIMLIIGGAFVLKAFYGFVSLLPSSLSAPPMILLFAGVLVFVIAIMGCCGVMKESYVLLLVYTGLLVALFAVTAGIGINGALSAERGSTNVKADMEDAINNYRQNNGSKLYWDKLQERLQCCGIDNADDWNGKVLPPPPVTAAPSGPQSPVSTTKKSWYQLWRINKKPLPRPPKKSHSKKKSHADDDDDEDDDDDDYDNNDDDDDDDDDDNDDDDNVKKRAIILVQESNPPSNESFVLPRSCCSREILQENKKCVSTKGIYYNDGCLDKVNSKINKTSIIIMGVSIGVAVFLVKTILPYFLRKKLIASIIFWTLFQIIGIVLGIWLALEIHRDYDEEEYYYYD